MVPSEAGPPHSNWRLRSGTQETNWLYLDEVPWVSCPCPRVHGEQSGRRGWLPVPSVCCQRTWTEPVSGIPREHAPRWAQNPQRNGSACADLPRWCSKDISRVFEEYRATFQSLFPLLLALLPHFSVCPSLKWCELGFCDRAVNMVIFQYLTPGYVRGRALCNGSSAWKCFFQSLCKRKNKSVLMI